MSNPGQKDYESGTRPGHLGCVYSVYSLSLPWDEKCCVCNDIRANPYVHKAISLKKKNVLGVGWGRGGWWGGGGWGGGGCWRGRVRVRGGL